MGVAMPRVLMAGLLLGCTLAQAQSLDAPQPLANAPAGARAPMDAQSMPMMAMPSMAGSLQEWYASQKRPALVVYFNKKIDQLPQGWQGGSRLLIEENKVADGKEESRRTTVGVQRNTAVSAAKSHFASLFELSLQQEMKYQKFNILDSTVLHRKLASKNRAETTDIEYESLKGSVRFVLEVELLSLNGESELVGSLKDIHTGDITASVRVRIDGPLDSAGIDGVSRELVKRLLHHKVS